ncbi:hypothetical protein FQV27_14510 [Paracoccus aurantiacus]|uniref:Uncharacterized protein n=1 Tax=Paracoccus aurantiacus TaxID=2599412 RepID=A0A5C6S1G6_9RHOB|nr:hypothetical protein [Paracoccus aurantiacus]TXB67809.1 hypothetical protein FQV27_14510 [Paracoccus aurantiacus]
MVRNTLLIHLDPEMAARAEAGHFNFVERILEAVRSRGWQAAIAPETAEPPPRHSYALHHMHGPDHRRVKIFRRCYYYPYWHIEKLPQRWRWPVARATFEPGQIDRTEARDFIHHLRQKVMPGLRPQTPGHVLIPLQGKLTEMRSFQTMSPIDMVAAVAATGKSCIATLHPNETYSLSERGALDSLAERYDNLSIGGNSRELLAGAEYVATQNSAVAMDAYLLTRPVVLFAQVDFHHIALNVADIGVDQALAQAPTHKADYARYLLWFLRKQAIDAMAPDAGARMLDALKKGGWPI